MIIGLIKSQIFLKNLEEMIKKKVPRMGVEPIRPNGHMALNHACLPVPAPGQKMVQYYQVFLIRYTIKLKKYRQETILSSDLAGARTQDPLLKREMLYQLSYQVIDK